MAKLRVVPVIALCGMFLFLATCVVFLSTSIYRSVEAASVDHSQDRVVLSYLMSQLRANDGAGRVEIGTFGDGDALIFTDGEYKTKLYCYEGHLMELYALGDLNLNPESGYSIAPIQSLSIEADGSILRLIVTKSTGEVMHGEFLLSSNRKVAV